MTVRQTLSLLTLLLTLTLTLAACSNDCPACNDLRGEPKIQTIDIQLCGSEVPSPEAGERICTEITNVSYTFVKDQATP